METVVLPYLSKTLFLLKNAPEWKFSPFWKNKSQMIDNRLRNVDNGLRSICLLLLGRPLRRPTFVLGA